MNPDGLTNPASARQTGADVTLTGGVAYSVEHRDRENDSVVMHIASSFERAAAWCERNRDDLAERERYAICSDQVDCDDITLGVQIAEFSIDEGLADFRVQEGE